MGDDLEDAIRTNAKGPPSRERKWPASASEPPASRGVGAGRPT
jgi:hypothetical protein